MIRAIIALALILSAFAGICIGSQSPYVTAQGDSLYLKATPLSGGSLTQVWMSEPFCLQSWWGPILCAEAKGDEFRVGAPYKLDLPGPAWIALNGRDSTGRWKLWAVAKSNEQSPGSNFVAVSGPTLLMVLNSVTATPATTSPATVTPPFDGATATPVISTPPPPGETPIPAPEKWRAFTVYCEPKGLYTITVWESFGLVVSVPDEWCEPARAGVQSLLENMAQATPVRVEVKP